MKIKETYLPEAEDGAGPPVVQSDVDFTGAGDALAPPDAASGAAKQAAPVQEDDDFC